MLNLKSHCKIIGISKAVKEINHLVKSLSFASIPVLIRGESGTGKDLIARALYENGNRSDKPFIKLTCSLTSSLTENIISSAEGGTLLLDEIGSLTEEVQCEVLAFLEEERDIRIIATTNRDIMTLLNKGYLHKDLYYRLKVAEIYILPLRERREDIKLFIDYYLTELNGKYGKKCRLSEECYERFMNYNWPGNVRELKNQLEQMVIISRNSVIGAGGLSEEIATDSYMENTELTSIMKAIKASKYNKAKAARILGVSRPTLYKKMKLYSIEL